MKQVKIMVTAAMKWKEGLLIIYLVHGISRSTFVSGRGTICPGTVCWLSFTAHTPVPVPVPSRLQPSFKTTHPPPLALFFLSRSRRPGGAQRISRGGYGRGQGFKRLGGAGAGCAGVDCWPPPARGRVYRGRRGSTAPEILQPVDGQAKYAIPQRPHSMAASAGQICPQSTES